MESPESTKPAPSSDATAASSPTVAQDSPFFAYVSNLSPIKTVNDGCAPSAFRDLNFPSPAPVFTSPHANPTRKRNLLKRCQYASPDSGNFSLKYSGSTKQISENKSLFGSNVSPSMVASVPCIMKDSECEFSTQLQSCSSPSGCVDEFLADPLEDSVDSCGPSNLCLNETVQLHQHSQDRYSTPDEVPKECAHSQNCCPSGHANEILSNQMDCAKATDSAHTISTCDLLEDAEIGKSVTKETISKLVTHNKNMKGGRDEARERLIEDSPGKNDNSVNAADEDCMNDNRSLNRSSEPLFRSANDLKKVDKHGEIIADLPGYQNSVGQYTNDEHYAVPMSREGGTLDRREEMVNCPPDHPHYVKHHSTENGKGVDLDYTPNMHTESLKIVPLDNNQHDISAASCNISSENVISNERGGFPSKLRSEGCQYQRAMRKRLEFDSGPPNLENLNSSDAESAKKMEDFQSTTLSGHALSRSSPHLNQTSQAHMDMAARSIRKNGSSVMSTAPRPSGIGLHLNSVVNVVALNIHINVQSEKDLEKDNLSASGETELCCSAFQRISDSKVCLASLTSTEDVSAKPGVDSYSLVAVSGKSDDDQQWNQEMAVPSSSSGLVSRLNTNPLKSTLQSKFLDQCIAPCNMKLPSAEDALESEELSEMSPRKKRKKASEDVGCKRCNCKKSKCLKLYCDCFAAGVYCADACACQECFNRPEYGDTVLETRQQIENRNPLAFAPKVVGRVAEVAKTSGEENKGIKPTSARHKRGCNCKRSQCLKKYCECFQAKVGCSFGCRCEGCKNSYGKKDAIEVVETEHIKVKDEKCKNSPFDYTDVVDIRTEKLNSDKHYRRLSPFTPLQEEDCNGENVSKYQYAARRYISSPESSTAALFSHGKSQGSPTNSGDTNRVTKVRKGNSGQCPYRKELEVHDGDEIERSLPRWERLAERCNLRLLSSSSPSDPTEWKGCLRAPIFQGSGRPSVGSLRWHSSPITPMPPLGESRLSLESCSDSEPLNCHEDDTPDILKDACVPGKGLKSCSPNKKRVSPPHKHVHEIKTSSSSSMRSRKFILKSVPTFPSLTPYGNNITGHGT